MAYAANHGILHMRVNCHVPHQEVEDREILGALYPFTGNFIEPKISYFFTGDAIMLAQKLITFKVYLQLCS